MICFFLVLCPSSNAVDFQGVSCIVFYVVAAMENQGITKEYLKPKQFISSNFCMIYFNTDSLKTCQVLKRLGDHNHQTLIFR